MPALGDAMAQDKAEQLTVTFVGAHFGRKGGCVAVKIAEKALQQGLPIRVNIVSALQVGGAVWTDPVVPGFFDPYLKLLELDNVHLQGPLPNSGVRQLLRASHFSILTTFGDTFGYSAIESMSEHTPVIATRVCALPEFIEDGVNGVLLPVRLDEVGDWWNPGYHKRADEAYAAYFRDEVDRLASLAVERLRDLRQPPGLADAAAARSTQDRRADVCQRAGREFFLDGLYERVASEGTGEPARLDPASRRLVPGALSRKRASGAILTFASHLTSPAMQMSNSKLH